MSLDYKSIGNRIRLVRHRRRLSQAMLSELIDKTPSYISCIENGFKSMSLETFVLIANALRVSPTQLLLEQLTCTEIHASKEITLLLSGKRFVKGKLHLMSHGYLNFVLMSVLPSLWHNKVSYAIINYLEDKFIVTGGEGCRVGKLSGAKSIPPRSFSKRTFKNLFWICCGCRQDLCYAGGRSPGSKQRDRRCCGLH